MEKSAEESEEDVREFVSNIKRLLPALPVGMLTRLLRMEMAAGRIHIVDAFRKV